MSEIRKRKVVILGSTGSIGTSALKVARQMPERMEVVGLAAGTRVEELAAQAKEFVDATNKYRCMHGAPDLKWSAAVAQSAQEWADRGVFSHSQSYKIAPPAGTADHQTVLPTV